MSTHENDIYEEKLMEQLVEQNEDALGDYWAEHIAEGVLDDDMPDAFDSWLSDLTLKELQEILKKI